MTQIVFKLNGKVKQADGRYGPDYTLNEYLRVQADLRGTKTMCFEGGCGACIVSIRVAFPPANEMKTFAVNSCLVSLLSCHGWEITTIKGIGNQKKGYHEIQSRLAEFNGSQCGYCSPGFVLNMYSLYEAKNKIVSSAEIENSFGSNICRCTGYRPILDAFKSFAFDAKEQATDLEDLGILKRCNTCEHSSECRHENLAQTSCLKNHGSIHDEPWCLIEKEENKMITVDCGKCKWYKVYCLEETFKAMQNGEYKLIAGNTGHGVFHTYEYPPNVIDISSVYEIRGYTLDINLILGAGMTMTETMEVFLNLSEKNEDFLYLKEFHEHMDLVAHVAVRNIGTVGGNLFLKYTYHKFQSDLFVMFSTVGGMITIAEGIKKYEIISLSDFLQNDMTGKIILNVILPPLSKCCFVKTYKIMPRTQNSHAIVNAGFLFKFHHNSHLLESATLVYGGISPNFVRAQKTESVIVGKDPYTNETLQIALNTLLDEIRPTEDPPEPSAAFRKKLAVALYYKAILNLCPDDKIRFKYRSGGSSFKRITSKGCQVFDTDKNTWPLNQPVFKIDGLVQCGGEALFSNDINTYVNDIFAAFVTADAVPGSIIKDFDTTEAFKLSGVLGFYTVKDIPGNNTFIPLNVPIMTSEEEILCSSKVLFNGQPTGIVVATRQNIAALAAKLVKTRYLSENTSKPLLTIDDVLKSPDKNEKVITNSIVEPTEVSKDIQTILRGEFKLRCQYHYTLEPQTCTAILTEDGLEVHSATQWIDLVHVAVAQCLKLPLHKIKVIVSRVGGGYGSKISRASQIACAAALVTFLQRKTCRFILPLDTNMKSIGKRLPTNSTFEVGINSDGVIQYLKNSFYQDCGHSFNEMVSPMTVKHFQSCYDSKKWRIEANSVITDTASNTWCRAPGSTEGIATIENIMEYIAFETGKDSIDIRLANMTVDKNPIMDMIKQIKSNSNYDTRLVNINEFNEINRWRKRAIKLIPMKFEIHHFGNFNSIVSVFHGDSTVSVIHGGIEMGQGINTKVAQVCAYILGVPYDKVIVNNSSASYFSPNAMTTGGSIGSECVAFATMKACEILLSRLAPIRQKGIFTWEELINKAYKDGIDLQASYMYSAEKDDIKPYSIYAVCVLEVEIDILTGNHDIRRVDLLQDTGQSLSPKIDIGQIEGAFVMGLGYWTSEKLVYDENTGKLLTDSTWNYKPPGVKDIPADMRIYLSKNTKNKYGVLQSKATGEPAFCLATVVIHALREAVRRARLDDGYSDEWVEIENPCTVENIFNAVDHKIEHFLLK